MKIEVRSQALALNGNCICIAIWKSNERQSIRTGRWTNGWMNEPDMWSKINFVFSSAHYFYCCRRRCLVWTLSFFYYFIFHLPCHSFFSLVVVLFIVFVDWEWMFTSSVCIRRWKRGRVDQLSIGRQPQVAVMFYVKDVPGFALFMLFFRDVYLPFKTPFTEIVVVFVLSLSFSSGSHSRHSLMFLVVLYIWRFLPWYLSSPFHSTQTHLDDPPPGHLSLVPG